MSTMEPQRPQQQPSDYIPNWSARFYTYLFFGFIGFLVVWGWAGLGGTIQTMAFVFSAAVVMRYYKFTALPVVEVVPATVPAPADFEAWEREL